MSRTATAVSNTATGLRFRPCEFVSSPYGYNPPAEIVNPSTMATFKEANSQEFKAGDMVYLNAGAVTQILTAGTGAIAGFALNDATNVTTGNAGIRVQPVYPGLVYAMNVWSSTESGTDAESVGLLVGGIYNLMQFTVTETDGSTTYCTGVNLDAATAARVVIVGLQKTPDLASTSTYVRALVKFLPYLAASGSATNFYRGTQLDA
jgi:hypothetical protein